MEVGNDEKLIIIMCGLPARGKSYITRKISNYLNWLNINNKVFNVGQRRRKIGSISSTPITLSPSLDTIEEIVDSNSNHNADFFNPNSNEKVKLRDNLALNTLDELLNYLNFDDGKVAIFDATNTTIKRRNLLLNHINKNFKTNSEYKILFLESICTDQNIIEENISLKLNGPDYINHNKELSLNDFKKRLENYEKCYETINSNECINFNAQYLKIINILNLESFNINGFLPLILYNFLKKFNIIQKNIWLTSNNDINEISINLPSDFSKNVQIYSNNYCSSNDNNNNFHKINKDLNLDNVHDLILEFETSHEENILIQTSNELFVNGLLKYFLSSKQILETDEVDFTNQIICINPKLYSVGFATFDIPIKLIEFEKFSHHNEPNFSKASSSTSLPSLAITRSNSNESTYHVQTPKNNDLWQQFNYTNLNVSELSKKLEELE